MAKTIVYIYLIWMTTSIFSVMGINEDFNYEKLSTSKQEAKCLAPYLECTFLEDCCESLYCHKSAKEQKGKCLPCNKLGEACNHLNGCCDNETACNLNYPLETGICKYLKEPGEQCRHPGECLSKNCLKPFESRVGLCALEIIDWSPLEQYLKYIAANRVQGNTP